MTIIVGIEGHKRSGKNEFAAGLGWRTLAFADPLRRELLTIDPLVVTPDNLRFSDVGVMDNAEALRLVSAFMRANAHLGLDNDYGRTFMALNVLNPFVSAGGASVRLSTVIRQVGWEGAKEAVPEVRSLMQLYGTDAIRAIFDRDIWWRTGLRLAQSEDSPVAITDVRFPDEANAIREAGGYLVKIVRPSLGASTDMHASEAHIDDLPCDREVVNDSTVDALHAAAREVAEHLVSES